MKKICVLLAALLLLPALACGEAYTIGEVREQAEALGRWIQTYEAHGRTVEVDAPVLVPEAQRCPVITAVSHPIVVENQVFYKGSGMNESDIAEIAAQAWGSEETFLNADEIQMKYAYAENSSLTIGEVLSIVRDCCLDLGGEQPIEYDVFNAYVCSQPRYRKSIDSETLLEPIGKGLTGYYKCALRQVMEGIPILMGPLDCYSWPKTHKLMASVDKWKRRTWMGVEKGNVVTAFSSTDYSISLWPKVKRREILDDVPLLGVDEILSSVEKYIIMGHICHVYSVRFGYGEFFYGDSPEEIALFPVYMIECIYLESPDQKERSYADDAKTHYDRRLNFKRLMLNAQTGEVFDPIPVEPAALDCPEIIKWEDVQS